MSHGIGPDDLLAHHGQKALLQVLSEATPASPQRDLQATLSKAAAPKRTLASFLDDKAWLTAVQQRDQEERQGIENLYRSHGMKGRLDQALCAARQELQTLDTFASQGQDDSPKYKVIGGCLHMLQREQWQRLANFNARVVSEWVVDDGAEVHRWVEIEGTTRDGKPLPKIRITLNEFSSESWYLQRWGTGAIAAPGALSQGHLRNAILTLSTPTERTSFGHTGWREIEGQRVFLHGGGAIGAGGVDVALDGPLARYILPSKPKNLRAAVEAAFKILKMAPPEVAYPLLLAAFRAPLCEVLPVDGAIHFFGRTGSLKSSLAAILVSFFAQGITHASLPASFADTLASLELTLHRLKDVVVVVDEYVPRSTDSNDDARKKAIALFRSIGNGAARGRLRSDLSMRPSRPPRALVITTGEEIPGGESIVARLLTIEFHRDTVNRHVLTELQGVRDLLAEAMVGYLIYLAPRLEALRSWAPARHRELQRRFEKGSGHLRASSMAAHLALAAETLVEYAMASGGMTQPEADHFVDEAYAALEKATRKQSSETQQENPARRFLLLLGELLETKQARLLEPSEDTPADGTWPTVIGWREEGCVRLWPEASYVAVAEFARRQGQPLSLSSRNMSRALRDLGVLVHEPGRCTVQRLVRGKKVRVLELKPGVFDEPESLDEPDAYMESPLPSGRHSL